MTRNELIEKLKKIRALAKDGVAGEMSNASKKLNALMKKFGITDQDLAEDETTDFFMIDAREQAQLAVQVIHTFLSPKIAIRDITKMKNGDRKFLADHGHGDRNANIAIDCTRGEYLQILFLYSTYLEDYKKQLAAFEYAYYAANKLLPKASDCQEGKHVDDEVVEQAAQMQLTIRKKELHKAIENN